MSELMTATTGISYMTKYAGICTILVYLFNKRSW